MNDIYVGAVRFDFDAECFVEKSAADCLHEVYTGLQVGSKVKDLAYSSKWPYRLLSMVGCISDF